MAKKQDSKTGKVVGFLGVGFDNTDGEQRYTRSDHFFLVGGSQETHEKMQDTAIRFDDELKRRGKPLEDLPAAEVVEIFYGVQD